jgi:hypothetical protein
MTLCLRIRSTLLRPDFTQTDVYPISVFQALIAFKRLFSRDLRRDARLRWCNPFEAALSIFDTVSRYATVAPSLSLLAMSLSNCLIDERKDERWPMFCTRRLLFCRARFRAWGVLAKVFPLIKGSNNGRGNMVNFRHNVKPNHAISA